MTTYNTYAAAKIAMPLACIIEDTDSGLFFGMPTREGTTLADGSRFAEPQYYCMTVEKFLADGHKFVSGDIYLDDFGVVMVIGEDISVFVSNDSTGEDAEMFILRAEALEEKPKPFLQTGEEFEHTKTLNFIYERLIEVHGENPNLDYMHKLKNAIMMVEDRESPCNKAAPQYKPKRTKVEYVKCEYGDKVSNIVMDFENNAPLYKMVNDEYWTIDELDDLFAIILDGGEHIYRRIKTEIDDRQEFIDTYMSFVDSSIGDSYDKFAGKLYDSGKFKLVDGE